MRNEKCGDEKCCPIVEVVYDQDQIDDATILAADFILLNVGGGTTGMLTVDGLELLPLLMRYEGDRDFYSVGWITEGVFDQMRAAGIAI